MAVEDTLIATMPPNFHNGERLGTACLSLLAVAYFTGRVAVLPAALHFEKYYYLWEFIDVEQSVLKVHFRESHFLSKARSHARRGVNAARVQVREDGTVSAGDYGKGDSAALYVSDLRPATDKAYYAKLLKGGIAQKGGGELYQEFKVRKVTPGAPTTVDFSYELLTGAGFIVERRGGAAVTDLSLIHI